MTYEIELKARLNDPKKAEQQAAKIGTFHKEVFKEDVYFRRQGDNSHIPDERYRLRREEGEATVTFKNKIVADGIDVYEEVEFIVDDAHAFFRFTAQFGFEPFVVKRKWSRVYQVGRANIELNRVEHIGHFTEIEILSDDEADIPAARQEVGQLLLRLGLKEADLEPRRYIDLIQSAYPVQYRFVNDKNLDWPFEEINS